MAHQCLSNEVAEKLVRLDDKQLEYFRGISCDDLAALKACTEETLRATGLYDEDIKAIEVLDEGSLMLLKKMGKKDVNQLRCQTCLSEETYQALRAWGTDGVNGIRSDETTAELLTELKGYDDKKLESEFQCDSRCI